MRYYEINFYGEGHEKDWSFYIKSETDLSLKEIKKKLKREFLGVDGLEKHHIRNIDSVDEITAEQFTSFCGIEA